ncbi:MAG TPA: hypothetical protein PLV68_15885, partial [Ilumatobacteraceae bacterium]|nr:hypothetical protein [Ilumatobacteraceae bacterium]
LLRPLWSGTIVATANLVVGSLLHSILVGGSMQRSVLIGALFAAVAQSAFWLLYYPCRGPLWRITQRDLDVLAARVEAARRRATSKG